jgi:hypothetical protein
MRAHWSSIGWVQRLWSRLMDDPRRTTWAGLGAAVAVTGIAVGAGVYTGSGNGLTINSNGQIVPASHIPPWNGFLILCYALIFIGGYCILAALFHHPWLRLPGVYSTEAQRGRPPLLIDFDTADPLCVQDRRQGAMKVPASDVQIRVRVSNIGPVGVNGVRLRLVERNPDPAYTFYLTIMHDRSPYSRSAIDGERCPAGGSAFIYFDLVYRSYRQMPNTAAPPPVVSYADEYLSAEQLTRSGPFRAQDITVEADGYWEDDRTAVVPSRQSFHIEYADNGGDMTLTTFERGS